MPNEKSSQTEKDSTSDLVMSEKIDMHDVECPICRELFQASILVEVETMNIRMFLAEYRTDIDSLINQHAVHHHIRSGN